MSEHAKPAPIDENPHTAESTTDGERAAMLTEYLERLTDEFGETPRLMPLDSEGKGPIIQGRCSLDSPEGRSYIVDGTEAARQIREEGARGFAIYAGKPEHNTEDVVLVDVDDRDTFPYEEFPATLIVLSGSARGEHFTYRNGGDVSNASGKDGVDGEVRAHNWFCVTPGSIHPSDGVYHIYDGREIETLHSDEVPLALRPASDRQDIDDDYKPDPNSNATAVVRENAWISEYLDGHLSDPDRSKKDFAVCRTFVSAGVDEEEARQLMASSNATKVDADDAADDYWTRTWTGARAKERAENGDDYMTLSWEHVREQYAEEGRQVGRYYAAAALEERTAWMDVLEEDRLWVYNADIGRFGKWGEQQASAMLERGLAEWYSRVEKGEVIDRLKARNQVHRDELNGGTEPGYHLCVGDGVVDLKTGELLPHDPMYRFTRGVSYDYEGAADPEPVIEFLDDITRRVVDRDTLLDHLAHGLMPGHPYRAFVMMYGEGANGKTQLGRLFRGFVGSENAASVELQDLTGGDDFATGALPGKMVNIGDDVEVSEIRNASALKSLTGSGIMRANEKNEKQYDFENEAAMFFSANEPPRITEEKDSIADRLYPIELPYQFRGESEYDPEDPLHKRKVTGVAEGLLADDAAMRGLLQLCVEHAQRLIEADGEYSMPEGPSERRLIYESASDPIARFALRCLEKGEFGDAVLKDDAYSVYKALCEADDERTTDDKTFKRMLTQQSGVDIEATRVRWLTPSDSREQAWRYVSFAEEARKYMNGRIEHRYFPDETDETHEEVTGAGEGNEEDDRVQHVFRSVAVADAARSLTGYVTVTVEVATTHRLGEESNGVKAAVKDESGAIDVVAWDEPYTNLLEEAEGECIALKNVEVSEYEGKRQLSPVDGLTEIEEIQTGVGHTEGEARGDKQSSLARRAEADGGQRAVEGMQARVFELLRGRNDPKDVVSLSEIAGALNESPDDVEGAIGALAEKGRVIRHPDGVSLE